MYRWVIFDLDGTLLNTIDDLADAGNWVCERHGWPTHQTAEYCYMVGNGIPKLVERFTPPEHRDPETLKQVLAEFSARYDAHKEDKTAAYPGMVDLVRRLDAAGVVTAVLSNKADDMAGPVVERYYPSLFSVVQGALPGVPVKPDPALLRRLMEPWGPTPSAPCSWGTATWISARRKTADCPAAACCGASAPRRSWRRRTRISWCPTPSSSTP